MNYFRYIFIASLLFAGRPLLAQDSTSNVAQWEFSAEKISAQEYSLHFEAKIDSGWKLFSTTMSDDDPHTRIVPDSAALSNITVQGTRENGRLQTEKNAAL